MLKDYWTKDIRKLDKKLQAAEGLIRSGGVGSRSNSIKRKKRKSTKLYNQVLSATAAATTPQSSTGKPGEKTLYAEIFGESPESSEAEEVVEDSTISDSDTSFESYNRVHINLRPSTHNLPLPLSLNDVLAVIAKRILGKTA